MFGLVHHLPISNGFPGCEFIDWGPLAITGLFLAAPVCSRWRLIFLNAHLGELGTGEKKILATFPQKTVHFETHLWLLYLQRCAQEKYHFLLSKCHLSHWNQWTLSNELFHRYIRKCSGNGWIQGKVFYVKLLKCITSSKESLPVLHFLPWNDAH